MRALHFRARGQYGVRPISVPLRLELRISPGVRPERRERGNLHNGLSLVSLDLYLFNDQSA